MAQISKDEWIQKAKALLFDVSFFLENDCLRTEVEALIEEGGHYHPEMEGPTSKLRWPNK